MLYLKCTAEVRKAIGLRDAQLIKAQPNLAPLGNWYIHRFPIGRTRVFLFMSEVSLLSFVLYQDKKKIDAKVLPNMFLIGLDQLLTMLGINDDSRERLMEPYMSGLFSKTDSRQMLGSMSDLMHCYAHSVEMQGGLASCDLTDIILRMNKMPQRTLNWANYWELTQALADAAIAKKH
jgi:hypothetical protein